ncbi:MAG: AmmeMemoRadiSam system protein B [Sulfuriflexus sp.]|nr:AmmeMemoRadiSam system protein B [Sulfuriflexus sp.]
MVQNTETIRPAAVAGLFYPANSNELHEQITDFLAAASSIEQAPLALIVPHAGYIYSGPIAASAYVNLRPLRNKIQRVILLGPSHRVGFRGLATSGATFFTTPLGNIKLDAITTEQLNQLPQVQTMDVAHAQEHSLEVQLPFLQEVLGEFELVPIVVGDATANEVAEVIDLAWQDDSTLIVISSDLSHYHEYSSAQKMDRHTCTAIESLNPDAIGDEDACGRNPVKGLLTVARQRGLQVHTLDLRNSGDTAGDRNQVVGYGAWSVTR